MDSPASTTLRRGWGSAPGNAPNRVRGRAAEVKRIADELIAAVLIGLYYGGVGWGELRESVEDVLKRIRKYEERYGNL